MLPIIFSASLFLSASAVSAQATAVEAQAAAVFENIEAACYTTEFCITATHYTTVTPAHGKALCPECATDDRNIQLFVENIKHLVSSVKALFGFTNNGLSLDIVQNISNALTEIINAINDLQSMPVFSCFTIAQASLVLLNITILFGALRESVNWVVFLGTVLSKIPILNNQLIAFVRDFSSLASHVVGNLDKTLGNSSGCFACSGVAIVNNEISQIQDDIKLFNKQFGQSIASVPLLTACDNSIVGSPTTLCTSSVVQVN